MLEQLPIHLRDFVEREVAAGHYESETEVIEEALARLADEANRITVEEAVAEALAQVERGEARELTDSVFDELLAQSERDANSGRPVRDDIRYSPDHHAGSRTGHAGYPALHTRNVGKGTAERVFLGDEEIDSEIAGIPRDGQGD